MYVLALNVTSDSQQRAILLHSLGSDTFDKLQSMSQTGTTYNEAKTKLSTFFKPKVNVEYERAVFRRIRQLPDETIDAYHTRLRIAAGSCSFYSMDSEIKSHIIQTTRDTKLRKKGLLGALSLDEIIAEGRNNELCDKQSRDMER